MESHVTRSRFNIDDDVTIMDATGSEIDDWEDARIEAIRFCGEVLKDDPRRIKVGEDWRMEVTDAWGLVLFRLDFHVMESPAMMGAFRNSDPSRT